MLIIVGPSASGKTQVTSILIEKYGLRKMVTYTTRAKRIGEIDKIDYNFITTEDFQSKIQNNFFLEYVNYNGNFYGTAFSDIAKDKVVILEPNGLKTYLSKVRDDVKVVYFDAPEEVLKNRMLSRGDKIEDVEKRLLLDKKVFNDDVKKLADLVVETEGYTLEKQAEIAYNFYKEFLK